MSEQTPTGKSDSLEIRLPVVRGEPSDEDAEACEAWFFEHLTQLAKRYPHHFVSVTRDGVVAADPSKEVVRQQVEDLQRRYGSFWACLNRPSDPIPPTPRRGR